MAFLEKLKTAFATIAGDVASLEKRTEKLEQIPRGTPIAYKVDKTTDPYQAIFSNGAILVIPDYPQNDSVYSSGNGTNVLTTLPNNRLPLTVAGAATGTIPLEKWKEGTMFNYWGPKTYVINPVNDSSGWDFTTIPFTGTDRYDRRHIAFRTVYELGGFTDSELLKLGATKL